jgi:hypothetical protein
MCWAKKRAAGGGAGRSGAWVMEVQIRGLPRSHWDLGGNQWQGCGSPRTIGFSLLRLFVAIARQVHFLLVPMVYSSEQFISPPIRLSLPKLANAAMPL